MSAETSVTSSIEPRPPAPDEAASTDHSTGERPTADHPTEVSECPPPLMWRDVLAEVRRQSETWELEREGAVLRGWTLGEGPPLYLLPSVCGNRELFALTMWLLRDAFRVVVCDAPEPVDGKLPERRRSVAALAGDLIAVADRRGDERFSLFGTAFGGLTVLQALRQFPQRIDKAVLHAGFARCRLSLTERFLLFVAKFSHRPLKRVPFFERIQWYNHRRWFPPFDRSRWKFLLENVGDTSAAEASRRVAAFRKCDFRGDLPAITTPVVLLSGEGDSQIDREREAELAAGLPNSVGERLMHCGRFPFLTHPHIFSKALKRYLLSDAT
jgi:pimeloyl-ACP methyl ester carboxylesterase